MKNQEHKRYQKERFELGGRMNIADELSLLHSAVVRIRRMVLAAMIGVIATAARAQTSPSLQEEIERLRIVIEVKQERIEALERELTELRRQLNVDRDRKIIANIQREVERLRGLRTRRPIEIAKLTAEVVDQLIEHEIGERYPDAQLRGWEMLLKHLGLVPPQLQLRSFIKTLYAEQLAGVYDDETKKLYVSDKFDLQSMVAETILAHEICHALQDQNFNLTSSPIRLKTNDDRAVAALCAIEGDATILMSEYIAEKASWRMLLELPGLMLMDQKQLAAAPRFLNKSLLFPYLQGMNFVMDRFVTKGPRTRNQLLRDIPRSTEQILHPEKYDGPEKDEPTEIVLDGVTSGSLIPAENRYNNVAGEFGIRCILGEYLPGEEAEAAADGWDGDRAAFGGQLDGDYALVWLSVWDSADEARKFADALTRYFKTQRPELAEQTDKAPKAVWLADKKGSIAIARKGDRVACIHANDEKRAARLLDATLSIAVKRVP